MKECKNCEEQVTSKDFNNKYKICVDCVLKERFIMEIEYQNDLVGYNVLTEDTLHNLCKRFKVAKTRGYDSYIGVVSSLQIKSVEDVLTGQIVSPRKINEIMEEI